MLSAWVEVAGISLLIVFVIVFAATDLDLISCLKAIPDLPMRLVSCRAPVQACRRWMPWLLGPMESRARGREGGAKKLAYQREPKQARRVASVVNHGGLLQKTPDISAAAAPPMLPPRALNLASGLGPAPEDLTASASNSGRWRGHNGVWSRHFGFDSAWSRITNPRVRAGVVYFATIAGHHAAPACD